MPRRSRLTLTVTALLAIGLHGSAGAEPPRGLFGVFVWSSGDADFGGFSAIELTPDGESFLAITDRGRFVEGRLIRDAAGKIAGIDSGKVTLLKSRTGRILPADRNDSEGLAIAPDGSVFLSLERKPRLLRFDRIDGPAELLPLHRAFRTFPPNAGFEAVAVDADGVVLAIPEDVARPGPIYLAWAGHGESDADFPVWRLADGIWTQPFNLKRRGSFLPVGADFGPDGRLYVLERAFHGIAGFASRVRSFTISPGGLGEERVELQSPTGFHDNLEGISVWRDDAGYLRLTLISDDNFMPFQRTEIVEYRLGD